MAPRNTRIARLCLASGLALAGLASAGPHEHAHQHTDSKTTKSITVTSNAPRDAVYEVVSVDGSDKYEVIVKGEDIVARVNGLRVTDDRVQRGENYIVILDDGGDVIKKLAIAPAAPNLPGAANRLRGMVAAPKVRIGDGNSFFTFEGNDRGQNQWAAGGEHPPVMLGVLLDSPGDALQSQLGVSEHAILIEKVMDGLPAEKAGLKQWDIVIAINGDKVKGGGMLGEILMDSEPGDELELVIIRGGKKIERTLELEAYDGESLGNVNVEINVQPDAPSDFPGALRGWNIQRQGQAQREIEKAMAKLAELDFGQANEEVKREMDRLQRELAANSNRWIGQGRAILDNKGNLLKLDDDEREEMAEELEDRLEAFEEEFEHRMEEIEDRLEERWDRMEAVFERMFSKVERLIEDSRD